MKKIIPKNEEYFERLFRTHYEPLCHYANKYIGNKQITEDIVQNFFIAVWEKEHLSVTPDSFLPYAYTSIKNSCINYFKSELAKESFYLNLANEWQTEILEEEDDGFIYKEQVRSALEKLPEKCRKVFLLKCVTGLKYKEIASLTGTSVNTVKYHMIEAFRIMKTELKDLKFLLLIIFF